MGTRRARWSAALLVGVCACAAASAGGCGNESAVSESTGESGALKVVSADDIAVAHTPPGGWTTMPAPVLAACTEPLVEGAVDMRGLWKVIDVTVAGVASPDHEAIGLLQRIEQCGDRVVITSGGIVHDMRADGTEERGVHDVAAADKSTPITVVASFEAGVHVLRPAGVAVEVRRHREGEYLIWDYVGFSARLERVDSP